jgi:predicted ATP-binding protein involved in virulence
MRIKKLELKNFARFENLAIDFAPQDETQGNVTVFIGNNGSGKTALLKSLALSLSWLVARIERERGSGSPISELDITNGTGFAQISLTVEEQGKAFQWTLTKTAKGRKKKIESFLSDTSKLADVYRTEFTENNNASFPLIIYYPVERGVFSKVSLKIKIKNFLHEYNQLDGYKNTFSNNIDFDDFFEWFRQRTDIEDEDVLEKSELIMETLSNLMEYSSNSEETKDIHHFELAQKSKLEYEALKETANRGDIQLKAVRDAIGLFISDFSKLRLAYKPRLRMLVDKNGVNKPLDILQLSQGEKSLMALVGDIARRLAIMNPALENPLHGEGVVMIDEIDMHLHPKWQRSIVQSLQNTFPNCQFILTTHSPAVISDSPNLLVYELNDGEVTQLPNLYGMDVNMVLLQEMDTEVRNSQIEQQLNDLFNTIQVRELDSAKEKLIQLEKLLPMNNSDLLKARLLLRKMELRHAQNQQK